MKSAVRLLHVFSIFLFLTFFFGGWGFTLLMILLIFIQGTIYLLHFLFFVFFCVLVFSLLISRACFFARADEHGRTVAD